MLQYKHFEVWTVVLWFTDLKTVTISLSPTAKLSSCLSSNRRSLWRHLWSYCPVTKSLPLLFCYATWTSVWKWRETSRAFFLHTGLIATRLAVLPRIIRCLTANIFKTRGQICMTFGTLQQCFVLFWMHLLTSYWIDLCHKWRHLAIKPDVSLFDWKIQLGHCIRLPTS